MGMRTLAMIAAMAPAAAGCTIGLPVGGMASARSSRYQSFTPSAMPRSIPEPAPPPPQPRPPRWEFRGGRREAVSLARELVGRNRVRIAGRSYPDDCTGLVVGVYDQLGIPLLDGGAPGDNGVTAIFRFAGENGRIFHGGRPMPGDLVFFRETYDLNRDGRKNDGLTHVGIVEDVDAGGTVSIIHRVSRGVVRYRMNLDRRHERFDPATGRLINDFLRSPGPRDRAVLTGELFAAYATLLPVGRSVAAR